MERSIVLSSMPKLPTPQCEILIGLIAGALNRVVPNAMAYGHREAKFVLNVHGRWMKRRMTNVALVGHESFLTQASPTRQPVLM